MCANVSPPLGAKSARPSVILIQSFMIVEHTSHNTQTAAHHSAPTRAARRTNYCNTITSGGPLYSCATFF